MLPCLALLAAAVCPAVTLAMAAAPEPIVAPDGSGGAPCKDDLDCQLNGLCTGGTCVCDAAWKGSNCSTLNLLPAPMENGYGSLHSNISSWGGGVVHDPKSGKWIMFVSEMDKGCGLGTWGHNSRCVMAEADGPGGPFTRTRVVMDSWCHGATPSRDPKSGKWLFNHMGSGTAKKGSAGCTICHNGTTPPGAKSGACTKGGAGTVDTPHALVSDSPAGPFTPQSRMTNGANCEPFFRSDGADIYECFWAEFS
jgi:hypothetical protein